MRSGFVMAAAVAATAATAGLLTGCGDSGDPPRATVTQVGPPTSAPAPEPQTVTATVTTAPPPVTTTVAPPPAATPSAADPVSVLNAYFETVNARDYARAWDLGGQAFAATYAEFVSDHATTAHYDLAVLSVSGSVVEATMDVTQTNGSHRYYGGTYTVRDGRIVGTTMRETTPVSSAPPGASAPPPSAQPPLHFERCADAWAASKAPITQGQPGYSGHLDADKDGVACEPSPTGE